MPRNPIYTWSDLKQFGISALTGEACAYSIRVLCDLSEAGRKHIAEFFGGLAEDGFNANWNSHVGDAPAVSSVMLPRGILSDLSQFLLFQDGALAIAETPGTWLGVYAADRLKQYEAAIKEGTWAGHLIRNPKALNPSQPVENSRNVHAFSGRSH